jgi:hypothetical protein
VDLPANKKAARSGGCLDFWLQFVRLSAILPPPASCRSKSTKNSWWRS